MSSEAPGFLLSLIVGEEDLFPRGVAGNAFPGRVWRGCAHSGRYHPAFGLGGNLGGFIEESQGRSRTPSCPDGQTQGATGIHAPVN